MLSSLLPESAQDLFADLIKIYLSAQSDPDYGQHDLAELAGILGIIQTIVSTGVSSTQARVQSLLYQTEARSRALVAKVSSRREKHSSKSS
jgi:hypothetical protein